MLDIQKMTERAEFITYMLGDMLRPYEEGDEPTDHDKIITTVQNVLIHHTLLMIDVKHALEGLNTNLQFAFHAKERWEAERAALTASTTQN